MASENETVEDIVKELRDQYEDATDICVLDAPEYADHFEAAHKREVDELNFKLMTAKSEQKTAANVIIEQTNEVEKLRREVEELTAIINAECRKCGECAKLGKDCDAGDVDGAEDRRACEKFVSKEVAELRTLLNELADVAERFISCKGTECDTVCGVGSKCIHKIAANLIAKVRKGAKDEGK